MSRGIYLCSVATQHALRCLPRRRSPQKQWRSGLATRAPAPTLDTLGSACGASLFTPMISRGAVGMQRQARAWAWALGLVEVTVEVPVEVAVEVVLEVVEVAVEVAVVGVVAEESRVGQAEAPAAATKLGRPTKARVQASLVLVGPRQWAVPPQHPSVLAQAGPAWLVGRATPVPPPCVTRAARTAMESCPPLAAAGPPPVPRCIPCPGPVSRRGAGCTMPCVQGCVWGVGRAGCPPHCRCRIGCVWTVEIQM